MTFLIHFKALLLYLIFSECVFGVPLDFDQQKRIKWGLLKPKTSIPFQDCGSEFDIVELNISSCTELPCQMPRGTPVNVSTMFNDFGKSPNLLKHRVRWDIQSVKTDARVTPDPCFEKNECFYEEIEGTVSLATVFVNSNLPLFIGTMDWEVMDDSDERVMCYKVPIVITP
ncbi:hypothetical protein ACFFRR_006660 [Megaselia abdita]